MKHALTDADDDADDDPDDHQYDDRQHALLEAYAAEG